MLLTRRAISSFPPGLAAGPLGLRPGHLKACVRREGNDSLLEAAISQMAPHMGVRGVGLKAKRAKGKGQCMGPYQVV